MKPQFCPDCISALSVCPKCKQYVEWLCRREEKPIVAEFRPPEKRMPPWGDKYILGIKSIDDQHEHLYNLINRIFENLRDGHRESNLIAEVLKGLDHFSKTHFAHEEDLFRNSGYPDTAKHIQEHQAFLTTLSVLHRQSTDDFFDLKGALNILVGWFLHHSQLVDREYVKYIQIKPS